MFCFYKARIKYFAKGKKMEFCQYEYTVARKPEGFFGFMKLFLILFYVAFIGAYFAIIYITRIIPLGALIPVFLWILVYFTWRYVKQEYKYEISGSTLTFSVIYGAKNFLQRTFTASSPLFETIAIFLPFKKSVLTASTTPS